MVIKKSVLSPHAALSLALMIILSGCAGSELNTRSLSQPPKQHTLTCADQSITGSYTILDAKASKTYLGRNVLQKGYQPIYITLTNNSHRTLTFAQKNITTPAVPTDIVAKSLHKSIAARAVGLGIPAAAGLGFSASLWTSLATASTNPATVYLAAFMLLPALIVTAAVVIPTIIVPMNAKKYNERLDRLFAEKALKPKLLPPQCTLSGIIFAPKNEFNQNFTLTLTDSSSRPFVLHSTQNMRPA